MSLIPGHLSVSNFMKGRLRKREQIEEHASIGANLACKLYFNGLQDRGLDYEQLSSVHQQETEHFVAHRPARPHERGLMSGIHNIQRNAQDALRLYSPNLHRAPCSDALRVDVAVPRPATPVHVSVASTLEMIGVANRIDFTVYDGLRYMDVVAELLPGERKSTGVRGLVVQILPEGARSSYVGIKTAALHEDGWAVITVKQDHWERQGIWHRVEWIGRKMVKEGFW